MLYSGFIAIGIFFPIMWSVFMYGYMFLWQLQSAAGIFTHLKSVVHGSIQQEPTPDLQPETLTALAALCVAQAQEVVTVKAINGIEPMIFL